MSPAGSEIWYLHRCRKRQLMMKQENVVNLAGCVISVKPGVNLNLGHFSVATVLPYSLAQVLNACLPLT